MKFFEKPSKPELAGKVAVFGWIATLEIIIQLCKVPFEEAGFFGWAFFITSIMFFIYPEPNLKRKFASTTIGSCVGVILAVGLLVVRSGLIGTGLNEKASMLIPLVVCLFIIIVLHGFFPVFLNNVGFAYFTISLISAATVMTNAPKYMVCALLGNLIANGGAVTIIKLVNRHFEKKAAKAK